MKVAAPGKRHKSGSIVGIGSFLSIASADSSGNNANGSLAGLAHSGTKLLGNVLHELHVVCIPTLVPDCPLNCLLTAEYGALGHAWIQLS